MLRLVKKTHIDFMRLWKVSTAAILAFLVPALIWMAVAGIRRSVEFTGGTLVQLEFTQPTDVGRIRSTLSGAGLADAEIQSYGSNREYVVRAQGDEHVEQQAGGAERVAASIRSALSSSFGQGAFRVVRTEAIGPRVGGELTRNAIIAMLISFGVALAYLAWRFDWRLGLASVLANVHDIVATFALIRYLNIEISLFVIGGILTVIGYSLADKVVVFDRVRELVKGGRKEPMYDVLNRAINETLPRTIMTGTTVLATLLALIIFGGEVLRPFAIVLLWGILVGTFSSIYVAGPVLLWIERKWPRQHGEGTPRGGASARPSTGEKPRPRTRTAEQTAAAR